MPSIVGHATATRGTGRGRPHSGSDLRRGTSRSDPSSSAPSPAARCRTQTQQGAAVGPGAGARNPNLLGIIKYLKPFSPRWKDEEPGEPIAPTPDPWQSKETPAVERGRALYHGMANCLSCHPAYAPKRYIYEVSKQLTGRGATDFRNDMYGSELTKSEYGVKLLPPDFTRVELRSIRAPDHQLED